MNHAIECQHTYFPHLVSTPRRKVIKHSLIQVQKGLVLVKVGKHEYALEPGEAFWIPFDCLASVTYFPNTTATHINFSVRLMSKFIAKAGYVSLSNVTSAIIDKLISDRVSDEHRANLLTVIKDEMAFLQPKLVLSNLSSKISDWHPDDDSELTQEQLLVLALREAKKRMLSGQSTETVVSDLFAGNIEEFEQLSLLVFGETLQLSKIQ